MRYALVSDAHGKTERLRRALADARRRAAGRILFLGDIGNPECYALLIEAGAAGVFGNWEVSSEESFPPATRDYVAGLPALLDEGGFLAAHAVPYAPAGLRSPADFRRYKIESGARWGALFPYLNEHEATVWQTLAEMGTRQRAIFFHGHTHTQAGWRFDQAGRLRPLSGPAFSVADGRRGVRYVIGVGSVGLPDDGPGIAYALYDSAAQTVEWVRLGEGEDMAVDRFRGTEYA